MPGGPDRSCTELNRGRLQRAERAVYQFTTSPVTWHSRTLACSLSSGGVASHRCAGVLWELDGFRPGAIELTVQRGIRIERRGFVVHETSRPDLLHVRCRFAVPVVGPGRLAVDLAGVVSRDRLVAVVDQLVRRRLVTVDDLIASLVRHARRGRPGIRALRAVLVELAGEDRVPDSDWNRTVARRLRRMGIPAPTLEHEVWTPEGEFLARLDLAWPEVRVTVRVCGEG